MSSMLSPSEIQKRLLDKESRRRATGGLYNVLPAWVAIRNNTELMKKDFHYFHQWAS